ncbi:MAG: chromate transporter [Candidatus Gastranaerophilales bacterium]|nr:chromate transporter [Candidatus Gastranaerophilales bacterium]
MEKINSINLFKAFFKIGLILLGGGYVIVPVIEDILIKKRNWLNSDELINFYCVAQCLPGIVAINTSVLTGYKLYKLKGALIAVFGLCLSPFVSIIIIAKCISYIIKIPFIESIFWGVDVAVIVLIYLALRDIWQKSMTDKFCYIWFFIILFLSFSKINPAILIFISLVLGFSIQKIKENRL